MALHEFGIEFGAMASRCEVRVAAPDQATARRWAEHAIAEVRRIEKKYSRYRDDSVTAAINRSAGGAALTLDDETAALIDFGATLWTQSDGLFDLTSGVLRRAWDFTAQRVPRQDELDTLLPLVGWDKVRWARPRLQLTRPGMQLDFGGIGKEYAADRAAASMLAAGARHGFVNLGGDVRAFGPPPDPSPWHIGIQHPRAGEGTLIGAIDIIDGAVATSGDYERYFELDGRRYCHLLDPHTGWPAQYWQSISVAAPACIAAGSCSTIAMLMPHAQALEFLREQQVVFLAVSADGKIWRNEAV
jgi:thiamine biosynthesis lipoprotein